MENLSLPEQECLKIKKTLQALAGSMGRSLPHYHWHFVSEKNVNFFHVVKQALPVGRVDSSLDFSDRSRLISLLTFFNTSWIIWISKLSRSFWSWNKHGMRLASLCNSVLHWASKGRSCEQALVCPLLSLFLWEECASQGSVHLFAGQHLFLFSHGPHSDQYNCSYHILQSTLGLKRPHAFFF